ncbi:Nuclear envelope phosphatase-regulatory subunit 1 [Cichlidogyrus casuarinus]|uniref:Transmembrane protein 188 n=1 Tax=Cichlidogyrus casuarinus TaxID=1844966 RepID=A0ABD2QDK0_9PLAT
MVNPPEPTEDLKAFERRLREIVTGLNRQEKFWRIGVSLVLILWLFCLYFWLSDPSFPLEPFSVSLYNHPQFSFISLLLFFIIMAGGFRKMNLTSIVLERLVTVLDEYNMGCDKFGRLKLRPRPNSNSFGFPRQN